MCGRTAAAVSKQSCGVTPFCNATKPDSCTHRAVANGIAERRAQLDGIGAGGHQLRDDFQRRIAIGVADGHEYHQAGPALGLDGGEPLRDTIGPCARVCSHRISSPPIRFGFGSFANYITALRTGARLHAGPQQRQRKAVLEGMDDDGGHQGPGVQVQAAEE